MLRLEWNALRVGDKVLVLDTSDVDLRLVPGVVANQPATGTLPIGIEGATRAGGARNRQQPRSAIRPEPDG